MPWPGTNVINSLPILYNYLIEMYKSKKLAAECPKQKRMNGTVENTKIAQFKSPNICRDLPHIATCFTSNVQLNQTPKLSRNNTNIANFTNLSLQIRCFGVFSSWEMKKAWNATWPQRNRPKNMLQAFQAFPTRGPSKFIGIPMISGSKRSVIMIPSGSRGQIKRSLSKSWAWWDGFVAEPQFLSFNRNKKISRDNIVACKMKCWATNDVMASR